MLHIRLVCFTQNYAPIKLLCTPQDEYVPYKASMLHVKHHIRLCFTLNDASPKTAACKTNMFHIRLWCFRQENAECKNNMQRIGMLPYILINFNGIDVDIVEIREVAVNQVFD